MSETATLKFTVSDRDKAAAERTAPADLVLSVFEAAGQQYAAVRPVPAVLILVLRSSSRSRQLREVARDVGLILDAAMDSEQLDAALAAQRPDLPAEDRSVLARSAERLAARMRDVDDPFTVADLAEVMRDRVAEWIRT